MLALVGRSSEVEPGSIAAGLDGPGEKLNCRGFLAPHEPAVKKLVVVFDYLGCTQSSIVPGTVSILDQRDLVTERESSPTSRVDAEFCLDARDRECRHAFFLQDAVKAGVVECIRGLFLHDRLLPLRSEIGVKLPALSRFFEGMPCRARVLDKHNWYCGVSCGAQECANPAPKLGSSPDWRDQWAIEHAALQIN